MVKQIGNIKLYSVKDLHSSLRINERTIRDWFKKGRLKGVKVGKEWYIPEVNLREFFNIRHFIAKSEFKSAVKELEAILKRKKPITKKTKEAEKLIKRYIRLRKDMFTYFRKHPGDLDLREDVLIEPSKNKGGQKTKVTKSKKERR